MPYTMSQAYAYFRDVYMKGMMKRFFIFSAFTYYGGAVAYIVSFYGFQNSLGSEGKIQSLYTVGLALQISLLMFTNVLIQTNIKDYNWLIKGMVTLMQI